MLSNYILGGRKVAAIALQIFILVLYICNHVHALTITLVDILSMYKIRDRFF